MNKSSGKAPRAVRACKQCRDLKVRCLPCPERDDVCQKCRRSGAVCIFEQRRPRKQTKPGIEQNKVPAQVAQVEQSTRDVHNDSSIDVPGISGFETASTNVDNHHTFDGSSLGPWAERSATFDLRQEFPEPPQESDEVLQDEHYIQRILKDGLLTHRVASGCLSRYRQMSKHYPFVVIPENATIEELVETQPFTLHALLVVSSGESKELQGMLERRFREQLLNDVVVEGEKSIDSLQALLMYLAWYHFFYIPMKQQFYQMLQIAISLCVDMKLDCSPNNATARRMGRQSDDDYSINTGSNELFYSKAARRAYVGCYCISTATSWTWCKPNNMRCTDYLVSCAQSLEKDPEYISDTWILPMLQMHMLGDKYHEVYQLKSLSPSTSLDLADIEINLGVLQRKIDEHLTTAKSKSFSLTLTAHWALSYAHEMDLLNPCVASNLEQRMPFTLSRHKTLITCLKSAVDSMETFLSLHVDEYPKLSVMQWWAVICTTAYLYRLCLGIPQLPEWDVAVAREVAQLETRLDLLCYRLQNATGSAPDEPAGRDLYVLMCPIFRGVYRSYERLKQLRRTDSAVFGHAAHANAFFKGNFRPRHPQKGPKHPSRCPAFKFTSRIEGLPLAPSGADSELIAPESTEMNVEFNMDMLEDNIFWLQDMP